MPMQDARYFDRHEEKPLGTAVFVFIGGTFPMRAPSAAGPLVSTISAAPRRPMASPSQL